MTRIALLPIKHRLVSLPQKELPFFMHGIVRQMFQAQKEGIFSVTLNALEVSIIMEETNAQLCFAQNEATNGRGFVVCEELFCAFQVDGDVGIESAGKRVNELSAPLANAGVSIFYLSTYQTDFILVKERRLPLAVKTLEHLMDEDSLALARSWIPRISSPSPISPPVQSPSDAASWAKENQEMHELVRKEKIVLSQPLKLAGLNREYLNEWALKVLQVLFYPKDVAADRFFSFTSTYDGISLLIDENEIVAWPEHWLNVSFLPKPLRCIQVDLSRFGLDKYGIVLSLSSPLSRDEIPLLYLSTVRTANIIVEKRDLEQAMALLGE